MLQLVLRNPWVQAAGLVLAVAGVCAACYLLSPVLVPLFFAFLVAYALHPVVDFLEARRVPRSAVIGLLAAVAVLVLLSIPLFLVPNLIGEADELIGAATQEVAKQGEDAQNPLSVWTDRFLEWLPLDELVRHMGWEEPDLGPRAILAKRIGTYVRTNAAQLVQSYAIHAATAGQKTGVGLAQLVAAIGRSSMGLLTLLGKVAVFAVIAGYLLKDFDALAAGAKSLVPPGYRKKTFEILGKIDLQIRSFLRGQMAVCLCLGVMYAVGLLISGTPFAVVLAVFGAIAGFVPYLGVILTIGPALGLTLLQHGVAWNLVGVAATFIVAQSIEGMLLTPRIVGNKVGLNPVWVILAIMVFGNVLGFLGLLLAVPIAATLKVFVLEGLDYYKRSRFYTAGGSDAS